MKKKLLVSAGAVALFFAAGACAENGDDSSADSPGDNGALEEEGMEPDLDDVPDVVAEVNGDEIGKDEFVNAFEVQYERMMMEAQQTGEPVDEEMLKEQTAQNLVDNQLLVQEADGRGFSATADDVDDLLVEVSEENGLESVDEFISAMEEQGMDEEELRSEMEMQHQVQQLIDEETEGFSPSEEDLQELYEQAEAEQEQMAEMGGEAGELPPFEEMEDQLEEQAQMEQETAVIEELLTELDDDGDITIHL